MLVAIVDFDVARENQTSALNTLLNEAAEVKLMPGCVTFRPYCDPQSETHVGILHEWSSAETFTNYINSPSFAAVGDRLRPIMAGAPSSRRYIAEQIE